jgi:DNA polymerase
VEPQVVVCLGATAAQALLGPTFRVTKQRGQALEDTGFAPYVIATVHPASILRAQDAESREREMQAFIADLHTVKDLLDRLA